LSRNTPARSVSDLAFSPDGNRLAIAFSDNSPAGGGLQIWDVSSQNPNVVHNRIGVRSYAVRFSGDGKELAVGLDGSVDILDVQSTSPRRRIALQSDQAAAGVAFGRRNLLLVVAESAYPKTDCTIQGYDTETGNKIKAIGEAFSYGYKCAFSADGGLLSTCRGNVAALYELPSGRLRTRLHSRHADIGHTAFSPSEPVLAAGVDGGVELWSTATGQEIGFLSGLGRDNGPLAFSADGRLLIIVSRQPGNVGVWDIQQRERLFTLPLPLYPADRWALAVSPDGEKVACCVKGPASGGVVYLFGGLPSDPRSSSAVPTASQTETPMGHD